MPGPNPTKVTERKFEVNSAEIERQSDGTVLITAPDSEADDIEVGGSALLEAAERIDDRDEGQTAFVTDEVSVTKVHAQTMFGTIPVEMVHYADRDAEQHGVAFEMYGLVEALEKLGF